MTDLALLRECLLYISPVDEESTELCEKLRAAIADHAAPLDWTKPIQFRNGELCHLLSIHPEGSPNFPDRTHVIQRDDVEGMTAIWWYNEDGKGPAIYEGAYDIINVAGAAPASVLDPSVYDETDQHIASVSPQAPTGDCPCLRCTKERTPTTKAGWPIETSRMFVCETCGNKRCPHSDWHGNPCSGSNNPGQPGSRYGGTAAGADWVRVPRETLLPFLAAAKRMDGYNGGIATQVSVEVVKGRVVFSLDTLWVKHWRELLSAAPLPDAQEVPVGESRWLIERTYAKGQPAEKRQFWLGITRHGMHSDSFEDGIDSMGYSVWTDNAVEAARFSSRKIADSLRYHNFHPEAPVEAVEHLFQCGVTRPDAGEGLDAARYRWLRDNFITSTPSVQVWWTLPTDKSCFHADELDSCIDMARQAGQAIRNLASDEARSVGSADAARALGRGEGK